MLLIPNLSITSITIRNNFLVRELGGTPVSKLFSRNWLNGIFSKFSTGHHATRIKLFIINSKRTRISRVLENATRWEFIPPPFPTIVVSTSLVARYVHISRSNRICLTHIFVQLPIWRRTLVKRSRNSFAEDIDRLLQQWYLWSSNISIYKNIKIAQYLKAYVKNMNFMNIEFHLCLGQHFASLIYD